MARDLSVGRDFYRRYLKGYSYDVLAVPRLRALPRCLHGVLAYPESNEYVQKWSYLVPHQDEKFMEELLERIFREINNTIIVSQKNSEGIV